MTFSIVAFDAESDSWGVAVASKFLAVGAVVPWGRAGAGAIATQAFANVSYGPEGLELLAAGSSAADAVERLTTADDGAAHRQLGIVDAAGQAATYTGAECLDWAGGFAGDAIAVQGNILTGPDVVEAVVDAYRRNGGGAFAHRLLGALAAGDEAGGDRRGRQSAALRVWRAGGAYGGMLDNAIDLRADDDPAPIPELERLLQLHELYFDKPDPATLLSLDGTLAAEAGETLARLGFDPASSGGLAGALGLWSARENFEERMVPGKLDPLVWRVLQDQAAGGS